MDETTRIIYGLDADLLYLSMASQAKKIYLLREVTEFQAIKSSDKFCYVSIDTMKECVYNTMIENLSFNNLEKYKMNFIQDYIFLGFMLGNDFLPGLPSVNLVITSKGLNGLNILLDSYKEAFETINENYTNNYSFIVKIDDQIELNYDFILEIFSLLNGQEEMYWRNRNKCRRFIQPCGHTEPHKVEIYKMENLMFKIPDLFELGKDGIEFIESKRRYYEHYYKSNYTDVKKTIEEYFKGLHWNAHYYFDKCPDYTFYFKHHRLPFVSDIFEWLLQSKNVFNDMKYIYPKTNDNIALIHPLQQLFMVLPIQSSYLLPPSFKQIMILEIMSQYFPNKVEQDIQLITKFWQALPEIEIINPYLAWDKIKQIKLTEKEESRNKFKKIYEIII